MASEATSRAEQASATDAEAALNRRRLLRASGRRGMGFDEFDAAVPPLRSVLEDGVGWYPLVVIAVLGGVGQLQGIVNAVGPEISASLGVGDGALSAMNLLRATALMAVSLPVASLVQGRFRRSSVAIGAAVVWAMALIVGSVALSAGVLALTALIGGLASGAAVASHTPLLVDSYPAAARYRSLTLYRAAVALAGAATLLVATAATAALELTWRGALLSAGLFTLVAAAAAHRLSDPGLGAWDAEPVRDEVWQDADLSRDEEADEDRPPALGLFESVRRVMAAPTVRKVLVVDALVGMVLLSLQPYLFFFLEEDWDLNAESRVAFAIAIYITVAVAVVAVGGMGERLHARGPGALGAAAAWMLAAMLPSLVVGVFAPVLPIAFVGFAAVMAIIAVLEVALLAIAFAVVPPALRSHVAALSAIFLVGVGGIAGVLLFSGIDSRFGLNTAIVALAAPALVGAMVMRGVGVDAEGDLDRVVGEIVEREELAVMRRQGRHAPMLSCRHVDFSYGQLQVLFDIAFEVDDGEMVALLGTNGAGKSTLLRVISGLGLPSRGSVTFQGGDITFLDAERRVALGISQIPGGKATFPPLSVVENLRVYAHSLGRDAQSVKQGIEATFEAFPRLDERRNQAAATLSGGEQQMLALGKALIVQPRLLLIDELSLGLAPKIVGELLEMVRRINADGTAVVLVEQSVNIALSLVDHAYFMEKGEIRFDGPAAELLDRRDLLRSVFLEGASKGLSER